MKKLYQHQRKWFAQWHTMAGVLAGSVLIIVSLTGAILVYEHEIDAYLNPELFEFQEAGKQPIMEFQKIIPIVRKQIQKGDTLEFIYKEKKQNEAYLGFVHPAETQIIINPYTGKITGEREFGSSFTGVVRNLHRTLLIPQVGRYLVGSSALMCVVLMITGLRQWIPKKWSDLKRSLLIRTNAKSKRVNYDIHNTLGFYFSPFISIISITGAAITFNQFVILALFVLSFSPPKSMETILGAKSTYQENTPMIGIQHIEKTIKTMRPDAEIIGYGFPINNTGVIAVSFSEPVYYNAEGHKNRMSFDQYSGEILFDTSKDLPKMTPVYIDWMESLHYGTFGGGVTRVLALITCLITATLFISGIIIWLPRWKRNTKKTQKSTP